METGGLRCREKQITDLTTGGAKETRQKKEKILDLSYLCWWSRKLWFKKQSRQLLGDGKLNDIIGWKKLTTIEVSMLLLSGTMVKNLSIYFVTPATEAEFVWENYTKIVEDRFFLLTYEDTFFDRRTNEGTPRLLCEKIQYWYLKNLEQSTRLSG